MSQHSGPVRSRDLRANIKEMGFERGVTATLELLLDEFAQHRQHMRELVSLTDQCIDQVAQMVNVGDAMQRNIEQIKRDREQGNEHG